MKIERYLPSSVLQPYVKEFIIIESVLELESKTIPDTSMVMAFRYKGNILKREEDGAEAIPANAVTGIRKSVRVFTYFKETATLLVIFNEGGISAFSNIPAHELFSLSIPAENLFLTSQLNENLEQLAEAKDNRKRIEIIEGFLLKKLVNEKPDPLIGYAVKIIKKQSGIIRIKDLVNSLPLSHDPFEKRFRSIVGTSPKQLAKIIRLRNLISNYPSYSSLTEAAYEAGYFDQAHFIKDFKAFTGQTPKDFFKSPLYW